MKKYFLCFILFYILFVPSISFFETYQHIEYIAPEKYTCPTYDDFKKKGMTPIGAAITMVSLGKCIE